MQSNIYSGFIFVFLLASLVVWLFFKLSSRSGVNLAYPNPKGGGPKKEEPTDQKEVLFYSLIFSVLRQFIIGFLI